jgi:hypothetical protein
MQPSLVSVFFELKDRNKFSFTQNPYDSRRIIKHLPGAYGR